ncbi:MAG: hypothetical protein H6Q17_945 [Bacteroidetes bacterium]|jgi:hypothetical protein|nr:hypothetical protein [Bacteroidota bacterium]
MYCDVVIFDFIKWFAWKEDEIKASLNETNNIQYFQ